MSSAMKEQHDRPTACEPADGSPSRESHAEATSDAQEPSDAVDLASQTANLRLQDENTKPTSTPETTITTTSNDDSAHKSLEEEFDLKPEVSTTDTTQKDQSSPIGTTEDVTVTASTEDVETKDEYDTPRLSTYIKLHNEVCSIAAFTPLPVIIRSHNHR